MTLFGMGNNRPSTNEVQHFSVTLELGMATLQIMTKASSMMDVRGSTLLGNSPKNMVLVVCEVETGLLATGRSWPRSLMVESRRFTSR